MKLKINSKYDFLKHLNVDKTLYFNFYRDTVDAQTNGILIIHVCPSAKNDGETEKWNLTQNMKEDDKKCY